MIYIVRHGQTKQNNAMLLSGRIDHPMDDTGRQQAALLGRWFAEQGITFDRVYSSPLQRAVETAALITGEKNIVTDPRLTEMDYGPYEGMDLKTPAPEVIEFFKDFANHPAPEGMEPLAEVTARMGEFLEEIKSEAGSGNILIATHAIALKGALEYLTPESRGRYWSVNIRNCEVYSSEVADGCYSIPERIR